MSTNSMTATVARREFAAVLETLKEGNRVVVTRHGKNVGVFLSASEAQDFGIIDSDESFDMGDHEDCPPTALEVDVLPGE